MTDYASLFRDSGIPFSTKVNRNWVNVQCPFCSDHSNNGGFSELDGHYNCWLCGWHDSALAIQKLFDCRRNDVESILAPYQNGVIAPSIRIKHESPYKLTLPTDTFTEGERQYLVGRGYDPDKLHDKMKVVGGGIVGEWSFRIIVPLFYKGQLVSWTGRTLLSKHDAEAYSIPRYKNLSIDESIVDPKRVLFNMDNSTKDSVILVEGPFDVMKMEDDCICSFGTAVTDEQIKLLSERYKKVYVMFDNEFSAVEKAKHVAMNLSSLGVDAYVVNGCKDFNRKDPGELLPEEVLKIKNGLGII